MFYQVNTGTETPIYFDDTTNINAKLNAEALLAQKRVEILQKEAVRFSICATFVNGNDTTWREVQESDPEDTICQVFDAYTGRYTECANKTEAFALNEKIKKDFLSELSMNSVIELTEIPKQTIVPMYDPTRYGQTIGNIPVEKL